MTPGGAANAVSVPDSHCACHGRGGWQFQSSICYTNFFWHHWRSYSS